MTAREFSDVWPIVFAGVGSAAYAVYLGVSEIRHQLRCRRREWERRRAFLRELWAD